MMQNLKTLLIIVLSIFLLSCKKEKQVSTNPLVGEWELTAEINGQTGTRSNYERGKGNITKYTQSTYEIMRAAQTTSKGSYTIKSFESLITKKEENQIVYDGIESTVKSYYTINGETLIISTDAYDGPSTIFTRIK